MKFRPLLRVSGLEFGDLVRELGFPLGFLVELALEDREGGFIELQLVLVVFSGGLCGVDAGFLEFVPFQKGRDGALEGVGHVEAVAALTLDVAKLRGLCEKLLLGDLTLHVSKAAAGQFHMVRVRLVGCLKLGSSLRGLSEVGGKHIAHAILAIRVVELLVEPADFITEVLCKTAEAHGDVRSSDVRNQVLRFEVRDDAVSGVNQVRDFGFQLVLIGKEFRMGVLLYQFLGFQKPKHHADQVGLVTCGEILRFRSVTGWRTPFEEVGISGILVTGEPLQKVNPLDHSLSAWKCIDPEGLDEPFLKLIDKHLVVLMFDSVSK